MLFGYVDSGAGQLERFEKYFEQSGGFIRELFAQRFADTGANPVLGWIAAPGLVVFEKLGIAIGPETFLATFLIGWYFWVRFTRTLYFSLARPFGLANTTQYIHWTRLWIPWQKPYRAWLELRWFFRQRVFHRGPSQRWAGFWELAAHPFNMRAGDILVGRLPLFQRFGLHMPVGLPDGGKSIAVLATSGGGKTAWLHTLLGSMPKEQSAFVFDMDGAMYNAMGARLEREGHPVTKIDVDGIAPGESSRWNPFHELTIAAERHGPDAVFAFAKMLAEALIVPDSKSQPVFVQMARVILMTLILYVFVVDDDKSLLRVRKLLTQGLPEKMAIGKESGFSRLLFEMSNLGAPRADGTRIDDGCNGALCRAIANGCGLLAQSGQSHSAGSDTPDNFRKTAIYQSQWLDDPRVAKVVGGKSDIAGEELKLTNRVVFMVSTLSDTQTRLAPLIRAFTMMTLYAFQRTEPAMKLRFPCNIILDEFPNMGRMDTIALALPAFRKYGARVITISQSIDLLARTYPEEYREFLNQSAAVIWLGISQTDTTTLTYLTRDVLGECIRKEKIDGYHWMLRGFMRLFGMKLPPARYQRVPRQLMTAQQAAAFLDRATGQILVTREGRAVMRLKRLVYWDELAVFKYAVHRGHGESFLRSLTRRALLQ